VLREDSVELLLIVFFCGEGLGLCRRHALYWGYG
jgi:hypothetical protein